jgi:hypothetical protein
VDQAGFVGAVEDDLDAVGGQVEFQAAEAGLQAGGMDRLV